IRGAGAHLAGFGHGRRRCAPSVDCRSEIAARCPHGKGLARRRRSALPRGGGRPSQRERVGRTLRRCAAISVPAPAAGWKFGSAKMNILCLASYEKGHEFLRQAKRQGCGVMLVTSLSLQGKAEWPAEAIDEIFYMPDQDHGWNRADTIKAVSYLARTRAIDRVVALDDFDVEMAASLREHLRLPGMGETTVRHFRDKLAMRLQARESGLNVPDFVHALNYDALRRFMDHTPAPWVLKPRSMAGAIGITKIHRAEDLWPAIELLGDLQSFYLLEQFVPGDIFYVDSIVSEKQRVFPIASGSGRPPMEVSHGGASSRPAFWSARATMRWAWWRKISESWRRWAWSGGHRTPNSSRREPMGASITWRRPRAWGALTSPNSWKRRRASTYGPSGPRWRWREGTADTGRRSRIGTTRPC